MSYVVVVIGDSMLDHYVHGDVTRISPEAPVPVVKIVDEFYSPGGAAHVAVSVQALNQPALLFSAIGPDAEGKKLSFCVGTFNVVANFIELPEWSTPVKTRVSVNNQQLLRYDRETPMVSSDNKQEFISEVEAKLKGIAKEIKAIIVSDYDKGTICDSLREVIHNLKKQNPSLGLFVDAKPKNMGLWQYADCVTPNFSEAVKFLNYSEVVSSRSDSVCESMAREIGKVMPNLSLVVITRSQHGCSWYDKVTDTTGSLPAFSACKSDVIGAGDTFISALVVAVCENKTVSESVAFANAASSLAVSKPGTTVVHRMELDGYTVRPSNAPSLSKIFSFDSAITWAKQLKATNDKLVFANGCFDLLHSGHVHMLEQAKFAGGYLLVGVNDNQSIRDLKGPGRPVVDLQHRMRMISALECVDAVVPFSQEQLLTLIKAVKPDVLVKGSEYNQQEIPGAAFVTSYGGEVLLVDMLPGLATTKTIAEILES
jgi:D-beta-D-heptose 7-phosphate kinase/D-beta-D-heptose 1-phosphate adenosyltransferase